MWRALAEFKDKYKGRPGVLCATGPSADCIDDVIAAHKKRPVLIGINRALALRNDFDFLFVDHHTTVDILEDKKHLGRTKYLLLPLFSRAHCNLNNPIVQRMAAEGRVVIYSWIYECPEIFDAPDYPLNDSLLYIAWGNAQSAIHLARHLGLAGLTIVGCDGGPNKDGRLSANKIEEVYGLHHDAAKRTRDYKRTKARIYEVAKAAGVKIIVIQATQ